MWKIRRTRLFHLFVSSLRIRRTRTKRAFQPDSKLYTPFLDTVNIRLPFLVNLEFYLNAVCFPCTSWQLSFLSPVKECIKRLMSVNTYSNTAHVILLRISNPVLSISKINKIRNKLTLLNGLQNYFTWWVFCTFIQNSQFKLKYRL